MSPDGKWERGEGKQGTFAVSASERPYRLRTRSNFSKKPTTLKTSPAVLHPGEQVRGPWVLLPTRQDQPERGPLYLTKTPPSQPPLEKHLVSRSAQLLAGSTPWDTSDKRTCVTSSAVTAL